ncbi:hypothetical protein Taro_033120 [Colocasia esculenta]|uniref:Pentatricopeptide repeat-containing protein n=1 Tax=Colocasia esculenta TaxID=4460 RepID=A0A843WBI5_COLES|nr:hypothetical protein [Colocasia esculenta]
MRHWLPPRRHLSYAPPRPSHPPPSHVPSENAWLALLGSCPNVRSLARVHGWLVAHGLAHNLLCETKLASTYASLGDMGSARMVFDALQSPDLYSWRVMFRWYLEMEQYSEAVGFYRRMRRCTKGMDDLIISGVLKACAASNNLSEGEKVHCDVVKVGNPDDFVVNGLVCMYAKCGEVERSRKLFDEIPERNVVTWTSMINGYVQNDHPEKGFILFNRMRNVGTEPNEFTLRSLLAACSKLDALHQGRWIHGCIIKRCMTMNSFLVTGLLDMYAKCGKISDARGVFDELHDVDLVSWTAMIVGYAQEGCPIEALKLFSDIRWADMVPNSVTVASILSVSAQLSEPDLGKAIHGLAIKRRLEEEIEVRNALISMYTKCSMIDDASCIFGRNLHKDVVAWNAMMAGYAQNGFGYEALLLFRRMRLEGPFPDAVTFVNVLSACACLGSLWLGCACHAYVVKYGALSNVYVGTALLNLYAKTGDAESARSIFDGMMNRSKVTWCAMIGGYGVQGDSGHSLSLFREMLGEDLQPNDVAFTSILSACGHTGKVGEGQTYFDSMYRDYKILPSMKHYTSLIDLLSRAGRLEEALEFIQNMPLEADAGALGAFLHGCQLHSRMELGEVAMRRMLELHPQNASYYLLMSNLYASQGRWDDAAKIRELMKARGLNKSPGCSSVEMDFRLCSAA